VIADGKCILDVGGPEPRGGKGGKGGGGGGKGELTAFDLASGEAKWKVEGEAPSYGSPVVAALGGVKQVVVLTSQNLIGVGLADGKLLWSTPLNVGRFQTATPVIDGNTVICAGTAFTVEKSGDKFAVKEAWKGQAPHQYNTPVLKDGVIYGLMGSGRMTRVYAQDAKTGKTLWDTDTNRGECGAILDAGPVLVGLSSDMNLFVFRPDKAEYKEVATYKVADSPTWAMPILAGKRIYVKDRDSLILWSLEG
jgi:outer membrane protein assembly factor BamB